MIEAIGSAFTSVIGWTGDVVDALLTTDGALAPLLVPFAVGIGVSLLMFGIKAIRSMVWGD